jgi:CBS domain-containing protein
LESAARTLWEHKCGILPVVDQQGRIRATITDRDICMGAYTKGARLAELRVANSMSKRLITCKLDDTIDAATRLMVDHRVRRLPVVDDGGKVCGVFSLDDLACHAPRDAAVGREALKVLTATCQPYATHTLVTVPTKEPERPQQRATVSHS